MHLYIRTLIKEFDNLNWISINIGFTLKWDAQSKYTEFFSYRTSQKIGDVNDKKSQLEGWSMKNGTPTNGWCMT